MRKVNKKIISTFIISIILTLSIGILIYIGFTKLFDSDIIQLQDETIIQFVAEENANEINEDTINYFTNLYDTDDNAFGRLLVDGMEKNSITYAIIGAICAFIVSYMIMLIYKKNSTFKLMISNLLIVISVLGFVGYKFCIQLPQNYYKNASNNTLEVDNNEECDEINKYQDINKYKQEIFDEIGYYNEDIYNCIISGNVEPKDISARDIKRFYIGNGMEFGVFDSEIKQYNEKYSNLKFTLVVKYEEEYAVETKTFGEVLNIEYKDKNGVYKTINYEEYNDEFTSNLISVNIPFKNDVSRIYIKVNDQEFVVSTKHEIDFWGT